MGAFAVRGPGEPREGVELLSVLGAVPTYFLLEVGRPDWCCRVSAAVGDFADLASDIVVAVLTGRRGWIKPVECEGDGVAVGDAMGQQVRGARRMVRCCMWPVWNRQVGKVNTCVFAEVLALAGYNICAFGFVEMEPGCAEASGDFGNEMPGEGCVVNGSVWIGEAVGVIVPQLACKPEQFFGEPAVGKPVKAVNSGRGLGEPFARSGRKKSGTIDAHGVAPGSGLKIFWFGRGGGFVGGSSAPRPAFLRSLKVAAQGLRDGVTGT